MKKIGLVGGTGPESTVMYYKKLNAEIDKLTEAKAMPDIAIESVNFRRAWDYVSNAKYDLLKHAILTRHELHLHEVLLEDNLLTTQ